MFQEIEEARSCLTELNAEIAVVMQQQAPLLAACKLRLHQTDVTRTPEYIAAQKKTRELTLLLKDKETIKKQLQPQFLLREQQIELLERHLLAEKAETVKLSAALASARANHNQPQQGAAAAAGEAEMRQAAAG